jgi:glutathione S-transferase
MAIWPWCYCVIHYYDLAEQFDEFKNVKRWYDSIAARPAVQKGLKMTPFPS